MKVKEKSKSVFWLSLIELDLTFPMIDRVKSDADNSRWSVNRNA